VKSVRHRSSLWAGKPVQEANGMTKHGKDRDVISFPVAEKPLKELLESREENAGMAFFEKKAL
jgi:hypothetical protein